MRDLCVHRSPRRTIIYLQGDICISRSPTIHSGDVRVARAVGQLPPSLAPRCSALVNCVVFRVKGHRSLLSCLSGGDQDGDRFHIITLPELIPRRENLVPPRQYKAPIGVELDRECKIRDGANFFYSL